MSSPGKAILYGFLIWLIVFVVAFAIFPIRESWRALFEAIMPVAIVLATTTFAHLYLSKTSENVLWESLVVGGLWFVISLLIDLPLMLTGPMEMPLTEYVADIGVTYLIIPIIEAGMGLVRTVAFRESQNVA
ncbi:MAG: hypothetical protein HKN37_17490 [Rhodothermales bacterium]|nr:hypothetical protein [Rhodothermales bacterium]